MKIPEGAIPVEQFVADSTLTPAVPEGAIPVEQFQSDEEKYGSLGQQFIAGLEGAAQGIAGPLAPMAERALGVDPKDIRLRAENNPWTHGLSEAAGLAGSLFTGVGAGALAAKAGQGAATALKLGLEGSSVGSRIAAGAAKVASEMALLQASDEASRAITEDPAQSVGTAAANVGLAAILGGVTGGAFSGIGETAKAVMNSSTLKEFSERLASRASGVAPDEKILQEFQDAHRLYHELGSEIGGVDGIRAQSVANLMPELNPKIIDQADGLLRQMDSKIVQLEKSGDKSGMVEQMRRQALRLQDALDPKIDPLTLQARAPLDAKNIYDSMNGIKRQLGEWGKFNKAFVPLNEVEFRNAAKSIGHDFKVALEDQGTWGKVGELQKSLNSAWHDAIPAIKDIESKFMTKIGGEVVLDPAKMATYLNQNGKATSPTIRQQMMGNFVDAVEKFQEASAKAYEAAGIESPFAPAAMGALKESLERTPIGVRLADAWYDKLLPQAMGDAAGVAVGGTAGGAVFPGIGGLVGGWAGKELMGPAFGSIIKAMMEKGASSRAFQQSMAFGKAVIQGDIQLAKSAENVFVTGEKALPLNLFPDEKDLEKLDQRLKDVAVNPSPMFQVAGDLGHYMPDHAAALSGAAMSAAIYLNQKRPSNPRQSPLDSEIPLSKAQKSAYLRTLSIAQQPLLVLSHIKRGTLLPQDVETVRNLYPGLYGKMTQKLMNAMADHLAKGESVPYSTRQSLSLFLGQPLDSTMTPTSIQNIQTVFMKNGSAPQPAQGAPSAPKKSTSKLGKISQNLQTPDQAREQRLNSG